MYSVQANKVCSFQFTASLVYVCVQRIGTSVHTKVAWKSTYIRYMHLTTCEQNLNRLHCMYFNFTLCSSFIARSFTCSCNLFAVMSDLKLLPSAGSDRAYIGLEPSG